MAEDDGPSADRRGLRDEIPRVSGAMIAAGVGALWGALGYSILWDGTPVAVDRAFVESTLGTLILLPSRLVLWAIRRTELALGRTFDLADNHLWIGFAASAIGAGVAAGAFLVARWLVCRFARRA